MGMFDKEKKKDPFEQVGNADTFGDRTPLPKPGVYPILYLDSLRMIESRKGDLILVAEFDVIQSLVEDRPPGSTMADLFNFRYEGTPGEVRKFLAALNNVDIAEVDADGARHACSDANPCHGRLVRMIATAKERDGKSTLTICKYEPLSDDIQKKAEELRSAANFQPF